MTGDGQTKGEAWGAWIDARLNENPLLKQFELARILGVTNSAVSKWRKGTHPADVDTVIRAAAYFNRSPIEVLRLAGHDTVADLLEKAGVGGGEDPIAAEIMSWTYLSVKVRTALLEQYRRDAEAALERARATAALLNDDAGSAAT